MDLERYETLVVISDIRPLDLCFFDLLPDGGFIIEEARKKNMRLAFNGSFFTYDKTSGYVCRGKIINRGRVVNRGQIGYDWAYTFYILKNGRLMIDKHDASLKTEDIHLGVEAGPRLVQGGEVVEGLCDKKKGSRIAIGWDDNGLLRVAAMKERVTLNKFARLLRNAGFSYALNLDGGGSMALYYREGPKSICVIGIPSNRYDDKVYEQGPFGRKVPHMIGIE